MSGSCRRDYLWTGPLGLEGPHQRRNAAVAHGVLMALPTRYRPDRDAIEQGFAAARLPGRFDRRGKWLFDVAHNPDGMRALVRRSLEAADLPRPIHALVSILGDKAWPEMLVRLDSGGRSRGADHRADGGRDGAGTSTGCDAGSRIPTRPPAQGASGAWCRTSPRRWREVQEGAGTVLVTGSFHTVGDVMAALGMEP